jgi:O-antigen/teichoic acid export membrane protein
VWNWLRSKSMIRNVKLVFSTNALMLCSGVITSLLSSWALGPTGRGDLMIVLTWPGVFAMLVELGMPQAHRFWAAKRPEYVPAMFSNALIFAGVVGVVTLGLAELVIPKLVGNRGAEVMFLVRVYALIIPMSLVTDLMRSLLEGARRFVSVGAIRLIFFAVQATGFVTLWFTGTFTVAHATYIMIAAAFASMVLAIVAVVRQLAPAWQPRVTELKAAMRFGLRDYPGIVTEFANWRLDSLMLTSFASSPSIGLYSVAQALADITTTLASSVSDALMPEVAAAKKRDVATRVVTRSLRLTVAAHLTILAPLWIAAPYILRFAYGRQFVEVTGVLRLLLVSSVIWSASAIVISGLNGLGHPGLSAIARTIAAVVKIVTLLAWLPTHGIVGAAWSSLAAYTVLLGVALFWILRQTKTGIWECLRPRWSDMPISLKPSELRGEFFKYVGGPRPSKTKADAVLSGID